MKTQIKKVTALVTTMLIMASPLAACKKEEETTSSYTIPETTTTQEATTEASTSETSTKASETTLPPIDPNACILNPLTGLMEMDPANKGKHGIGIPVNNTIQANPSRGTSEASVIFEYETEGGQTRLLCVFPDVSRIPLLGSLRSGRVGAVDMCAGTGCTFICWGSDEPTVPNHIRNLGLKWIDLNNHIYDSTHAHDADEVPEGRYCWRDREWMSEPNHRGGLEHCGVTRGDFLLKALEAYEIDMTGEIPELFRFVEAGTATMVDSTSCTEINVYFSSCNDDALFVYNPDEKVYYKSQYNGQPQMDLNTNVQIHFTNVFVLYCPINPRPNDPSTERHKDIHMEEGGTGYYISYGQLEPITWTKPTPTDPIKCYDSKGNEIQVNAGKSYICVVDEDYMDKTTMKE